MDTIIPPIERKNKILYILGLFCFVFIIVVLLIIINLAREMPQKQVKTITEVKEKIPSTVVETKKTLDKTQISFEVLNGSGINGSAARGGQILSAREYSVIKIGNADGIYQTTQLFLAADIQGIQNELLNDLRQDFPNATFSGVLTDSTASARLIIGVQ